MGEEGNSHEKQSLRDMAAKSIDLSAAITTLGVVGGIMIAFFLCFMQQKSFVLPFDMVEIVSKPGGEDIKFS